MDPGTIGLQDEACEKQRASRETRTPENTVKSLRVKGRSKNAQAKRYGGQAHPRPASQYRR
jgi:hypothetical protein